MFEIHEHFVPIARSFRHHVRPSLEIVRLIPFVAESEIAVTRRRLERRRLVAKVRDAQRLSWKNV